MSIALTRSLEVLNLRESGVKSITLIKVNACLANLTSVGGRDNINLILGRLASPYKGWNAYRTNHKARFTIVNIFCYIIVRSFKFLMTDSIDAF